MGHSVDSFHRGRFHLVQPASRGHRAGLDAMLLASAVPPDFAGILADLGAGAGAAGLAVAARCPLASIVLVENSAEMAHFARLSLDLPQNRGMAVRLSLLETDVMLAGKARAAAGLPDNRFDFVIMNPPFNDPRDRGSPDLLRRGAHVMPENHWEGWMRTAAAIAGPGGKLAVIARPSTLPAILGRLAGRFGAVRVRPVHPRPSQDAIRIVACAVRGSRKGLALVPPLFLHSHSGSGFTEEADALINGEKALFAG